MLVAVPSGAAAVPSEVGPSKNSKVPGVATGVTDAVSVTGVPETCGLAGEAPRVVVVAVTVGAAGVTV